MKQLLPALLLLAACSSLPSDPASAARVTAIRRGECPDLKGVEDAAAADAVAEAVRGRASWKSEDDKKRALAHLAASARPEHVGALLDVVELETPVPALAAILAAAKHLAPRDLDRVGRFVASDNRTLQMRGLLLLKESRVAGAADLLAKRADSLLGPGGPDVARVALGALGACGARAAAPAVLKYYTETEEPVALRALGRLWEQPEGSTDESKDRLLVLLAAHKLTMSAAATPESAEALLRVMNEKELAKFLADHAGDRFPAAFLVARAACRPDLAPARSSRVLSALLANKDAGLVAWILWTAPGTLDAKAVAERLKDARRLRVEGAPEARVADYAAARLESQAGGKREIPADDAAREALLKKWTEKPAK